MVRKQLLQSVIAPSLAFGLFFATASGATAASKPKPAAAKKPVATKVPSKLALTDSASPLDTWWSEKFAVMIPGNVKKTPLAMDSAAKTCVSDAMKKVVTGARLDKIKKNANTPMVKAEAVTLAKAMQTCGVATAWMKRELEVTYGLPAAMTDCLMKQVQKSPELVPALLQATLLPNDPESSKAQSTAIAAAGACITNEQIAALAEQAPPSSAPVATPAS
jgi:hypothetical protein